MIGYCVKIEDELMVRTVTETEVGAQVNGLYLYFKIAPKDKWSDEKVGKVWGYSVKQAKLKGHNIRIVRVEVIETGELQ